jgi:hypothetical protein
VLILTIDALSPGYLGRHPMPFGGHPLVLVPILRLPFLLRPKPDQAMVSLSPALLIQLRPS